MFSVRSPLGHHGGETVSSKPRISVQTSPASGAEPVHPRDERPAAAVGSREEKAGVLADPVQQAQLPDAPT